MGERPKSTDVKWPWVVIDCPKADLDGHRYCGHCDSYGWVYHNQETKAEVSEMMRGAMERHG